MQSCQWENLALCAPNFLMTPQTRYDIAASMKRILSLSLLTFLSSIALADEYGATALGVVKNMDLKKINEEAEAKAREESKSDPKLPRPQRISRENPYYKGGNYEYSTPGEATFFNNNKEAQ